ncbi:MAG: tRNA (adenosine(37)-N6)-threonylcarbamoyltransferase complex ATPase subunit type 1 TsaE [Bacteroidales bacterium]|jgi:tRNA threonylcarbamoyladenosine biosynthesis protein TsaE|nr:tRNA (adenosine(37)-N6)-threonylcarbamoyltransferase complex ATPase subunit type 1 TsaE [Bacteroidales bacterium]
MQEYIAKNLLDLKRIAKDVIANYENERIFAFKAEMGTGKTTFIKAICEELGVESLVNSPTFAIVNTYVSYNGSDIYHFDFYRLEKEMDALDIGFEEYLYSGNYCFIEWIEKIPNLLPQEYVLIEIKIMEDKSRMILCYKRNK